MVLVESGLNTEQVSLIRPIYIRKCILVLKQVILITEHCTAKQKYPDTKHVMLHFLYECIGNHLACSFALVIPRSKTDENMSKELVSLTCLAITTSVSNGEGLKNYLYKKCILHW